jgi:hypothetical protein
VFLAATNRKALEYVTLEQLVAHALDKELLDEAQQARNN